MDTGTNSYGHKFLELCKDVPLRILNGRMFGDLFGHLTCFTPRGSSCVDYCAASPELINQFRYFQVKPPILSYSDHCPIGVCLKVHINIQKNETLEYDLIPKPEKIVWNRALADKFVNLIQSPDCKESIQGFINTGILPNQTSVDSATKFISDILIETAKKADMPIKPGVLPRRQARHESNFHKNKPKLPKWHDQSCFLAFKNIKLTSQLLQKDPKNAWLRGKMSTETKEYNRLVKYKQKEYTNNMFNELESMHSTDPKAYMDLVKALRDGKHDRKKPSDLQAIEPDTWFTHFSELLGKSKDKTISETYMEEYVKNNCDLLSSELDRRFTKLELKGAIKRLKNNKSVSFDKISNEMLKCSFETMHGPIILLFNTCLKFNIYPTEWKNDILGPLHKSGEKTDPNNFRGICVSSCFGKLFNMVLRNRLEEKCLHDFEQSKEQISGQSGARTADHILVFHHIINKIVKIEKKSLYVCFFDLKKAFDTVNRVHLFYNLLTQYKIGGNFLKILQNLYTDNKVFIKLDHGLTKSFTTKIGVKQGCSFSPFLFNLFIDKLPKVFDNSCNPIMLGGKPISCLSWADDCVVMSLSQNGLQNAINKTVSFFSKLGLVVNTKKTKCLIFNKRGLRPKFFPLVKFDINGKLLENADNYTYLGILFVPSGAIVPSLSQLYDKASRAWFSISHVIYENKRMPVRRSLQLLDTLVLPVSQYCSEVITPLSLPGKSFDSLDSLLSSWEQYAPEKIQQRMCRMILSVHKKSSRLAVLGELGQYPVLLKGLAQCVKYEWHVKNRSAPDSLVRLAYNEMVEMGSRDSCDSWLGRVHKVKEYLGIPEFASNISPNAVSDRVKKAIQNKFEIFW